MSAEASVATCPRCGSTQRRGSDWCTLCFADLRPVPPPRVSPDPLLVPPPTSPALTAFLTGTTVTGDPLDALSPLARLAAGLEEPVTPSAVSGAPVSSASGKQVAIPCKTCGGPVSIEVAVCGACGTGLFDALKQDAASVNLPLVGDVMKLGKGARAGLAFAFAIVAIVVLFTVITILGHVF